MKPIFMVALVFILASIPLVTAENVSANGWTYEITAEAAGVGSGYKYFNHSYGTSYDVSGQNKAIQRMSFDVPTGTTIDYTLYYGANETVSGHMLYTNVGFYTQRSEVSMGGEISGYEYTGVQEIGRMDIVGYARNRTDPSCLYGCTYNKGLVIYDSVFGFSERRAFVFYQTTGVSNSIYRVDWSSNNPVNLFVVINSRAAVDKATSQGALEMAMEWITFAIQIASTIKDIAFAAFYWIKFFLWDYWYMLLTLYIVLTGAMAFNSTKDPLKAVQKFVKYQKGILEFFINTWKTFVDFVASFRSIFRI